MAESPEVEVQWRLDLKDLPILRRLGRGPSGYFYETTWGGKKCARKDFPLGSAERNRVFEREAKKVCELDGHPNVVKCFGYTVGRNSCSLVQEYVADDLQNSVQRRIDQEVIRKRGTSTPGPSRVLNLDEIKRLLSSRGKEREKGKSKVANADAGAFEAVPEAEDITSQIATGMRHLHENGVVHGDLKPRNVLVLNSDQSDGWKVKLADYGLVETKKRINMVSERTRRAEILTWKAPECLGKKTLNHSSVDDEFLTESDTDSDEESHVDEFLKSKSAMADVYSFGLTCSYILGGKPMSSDMSLTQLRQQRLQGIKPELPESASLEYLKFMIGACLEPDPMKRPTFSMICMMEDAPLHLRLPRLKNVMEGKDGSVDLPFGEKMKMSRLGNQKLSIFLSHSDVQKPFVRRLRNALGRNACVPFFDEHPDSLPRGEPFVQHLKDAARQADVAVVVLSDDFFTSNWPMIELEIFIEEQKRRRSVFGCRDLNIFPLFMGVSVEEFRNDERRLVWLKKWHELAAVDDRIDVLKWEEALGVVGGINGVKYSDFRTEEDYIDNIVSAVFRLVLPDLMWEVEHVKGKLKLCEAVADMFTKAPPRTRFHNIRAIGLYGMGGLGKTTICKLLCNNYFAEFNGKVWHVELGKKGAEEIQKDVLCNLVGISESLLNQTVTSKDQWRSLLRRRIDHKVFLAIDNVWNEDISREQVEALLEMGFHPSSLVVVTSRSRELLECLGIHKECCFEMPELDKDDATALLLEVAATGLEKASMTVTQLVAVDKVVECCLLSKGPISSAGCEKQYVPLVIHVLGRQLRPFLCDSSKKLTKWLDRLDLKRSDQKLHPIFSVLRLSYDSLHSDKHRSIFVDVALCVPRRQDNTSASVKEVCKWLSMVYRMDINDVLELLEDLRRDGPLVRWEDLASPCAVHELYFEFAKAMASTEENFDEQFYLYHEDGLGLPELMRTFPRHIYWRFRRIHFYKVGFSKLCIEELQFMVHVEVLKLDFCFELVSLDLQCLKRLRSLELRGCLALQTLEGLKDLKHLKFFRWNTCGYNFHGSIEFPLSLEIAEIYGSKESELRWINSLEDFNELRELTLCGHPKLIAIQNRDALLQSGMWDFSDLQSPIWRSRNLQVLHISCCRQLDDLGDLILLMALEQLHIHNCESLMCLRNLRSPHLKVLRISSCSKLEALGNLSPLMALQEVHLEDCGSLCSLQNLRSLDLKVLHISRCPKLEDLGDLSMLMALEQLHIHNCEALLCLQNLWSPHLKVLRISSCSKLEALGNLSPLMALQEVHLEDCGSLCSLQNLRSLDLKVLHISRCPKLEDLGGPPLIKWR